MKQFLKKVLLACGLFPMASLAALEPASLFTDHMVLQRDMAVPVWGTSDAGAEVVVQFGNQQKSGRADADGRWKLTLDPLPASNAPAKLVVSSGSDTAEFNDVVVGDVWICSGQSNMQLGVNAVPEIKALVPKAKNLRTFSVVKAVAFEEQDDCKGRWTAEPPGSAVAFSFAYFLEQAAEVPVGIILTCWGSSGIEAWMPRDMTETVPHFKTMMDEFDADTETYTEISRILNGPRPWNGQEDVFLRRQPNILYNAMMHPLAPYACRGVVWYQGERNTQSMYGMPATPWYSRNSGMLKYGETLKQWILRYREEWGNQDMFFLITMLPGYHNARVKTGPQLGAEHPQTHSWAWMRESQLKALELPNTAVPCTVDLGDIGNIHPKDKLPVGKRLALLAIKNTLKQDVVAQGPVLKNATVNGASIVLHFEHAEGLTTTDGQSPTGFWIAGDDRNWAQADAVIEGETLALHSAKLEQPKYVRYAFAGKPKVNLVNGSGLPAYPFRTDSFPPD